MFRQNPFALGPVAALALVGAGCVSPAELRGLEEKVRSLESRSADAASLDGRLRQVQDALEKSAADLRGLVATTSSQAEAFTRGAEGG
ncbi:MAG: hypothetical protein HY721_12780 [Planctomycetes bacterium]|nr:hypothetical protein [Planctomycetota bacterium]